MNCERSDFTVLVVDHDAASLALISNLLMAWQYRVQTAKDAHQALTILQRFKGLIDITITEFYLLGMNGFDFLKLIQNEFQIPVIMMSEDKKENLISNILKNGAAHFIAKPFRDEDAKDIWKYVTEAKEEKLFFESLFVTSEEQGRSSHGIKTKNKHGKRKVIGDKNQREGDFQVAKKPKLIWTPDLHNQFMFAIKQIGIDKVVPKKILEIMNVPNLTRENVASHLQKYRIFLQDVAEKGMAGGISQRALRSTFASTLPTPLIKTIQEIRANKYHASNVDHSEILPHQTGNQNIIFNTFNRFPSHQVGKFPYVQKGSNLQHLDQIRFEKSKLETNVGLNNSIYDRNPLEISSSNCSFYLPKNSFHDGGHTSTNFSSYGGGQEWMTSPATSYANFLAKDLKFNDMDLLNKVNEYHDTSEFNSFQDVQPLEQIFKDSDEISLQAEITSCVLNESSVNSNESFKKLYKDGDDMSSSTGMPSCVLNKSPINSYQNSNELRGNEDLLNGESYDRFTRDKDSKEYILTADQEFDMDVIEALFGILED